MHVQIQFSHHWESDSGLDVPAPHGWSDGDSKWRTESFCTEDWSGLCAHWKSDGIFSPFALLLRLFLTLKWGILLVAFFPIRNCFSVLWAESIQCKCVVAQRWLCRPLGFDTSTALYTTAVHRMTVKHLSGNFLEGSYALLILWCNLLLILPWSGKNVCNDTLKTVMTASEVYGLLLLLAAAFRNRSINTQIKKAAGSLSFEAQTVNVYLYSLPVTNTSWRVWTHSGVPVSGVKGSSVYEMSVRSSLVGQEVPKCRKQMLKNCRALSCVTQGTYSTSQPQISRGEQACQKGDDDICQCHGW